MIYLVGTNHWLQYNCDGQTPAVYRRIERFAQYIESAATTNNICGIAEEIDAERQKCSVAKAVARTHGIKYVVCEPSRAERLALNIPSDYVCDQSHFPLRENVWLDRLQELPPPILLICGAKHINTLPGRIASRGLTHITLCSDWLVEDEAKHGRLTIQDGRPI